MVAGTVVGVENFVAMARGKVDWANGAFGGFAGGMLFAIPSKNVQFGLGCGAAMAAVMALAEVNDKKIANRSAYNEHKLFGHRLSGDGGHH